MKVSVIALAFVIFMGILSSCARQDMADGELESLASWMTLGSEVIANTNAINHVITSVAFNSSGNPVLAVQASEYNSFTIFVMEWRDGQWRRLGSYLDIQRSKNAYSADIAVDGLGRPVVVWHEYSGIYVKRWNGTSWISLGEKLDVNPSTQTPISAGFGPSIVIDSQNRPVVVWQEHSRSNTNFHYNVYVKRWENDSQWMPLGDALDKNVAASAGAASIAIDPMDRIVVAWSESNGTNFSDLFVKRWNGSRWVNLGSALDIDLSRNASQSSLAISSAGQLYIAWDESTINNASNTTARNVYVKRWDGNNTWTQLGGAVSSGVGGQYPHLAIHQDSLMISWSSWKPGTLPPPVDTYVKHWNGVDRWLAMGSQPVVANAGSWDLQVGPGGVPTLAYYFGSGLNDPAVGAYIKQYK
jgi:hypothetical protein